MSEKMDSETPIKLARERDVNTCRVCNTDLSSEKNPVALFGKKSLREGLIECLRNFHQNTMHEDDGLSKYLYRSCTTKITHYLKKRDELKTLFLATESLNRDSVDKDERTKRGRKDECCLQSPLPEKASKKTCLTPRLRKNIKLAPKFGTQPSAKVSLAEKFQDPTVGNALPRLLPRTEDNIVEEQTQSNLKKRILPDFLKDKKLCDSSLAKGVNLLKNVGLKKHVEDATETEEETLTNEQKESICMEIMKSTPVHLAEVIMSIPVIRRHVKEIILNKINNDCNSLCAKKSPSVLRTPRAKHSELSKLFSWSSILTEIKERAPDLLDVLTTVAVPNVKLDGKQVPPLCTAYAVLMNTRNREMSMVQKMNGVTLAAGHATQKTFQRLAKLGITQSRANLRNLMDDIGDVGESSMKELVQKKGNTMRIVFDNIDFKILANIILQNHQNSDIHWMAQYCTFDRVSSDALDDKKPIVDDIDQFENKEYLLSEQELKKLKSDYTVLVSRVLIEFFPCLEPFRKHICSHIPHRYSKEMAKKSTVIGLPILPYNQSKHADVCQYLDHMQDVLYYVHNANDQQSSTTSDITLKESVLKDVKVPLCGDLLGRERVTGAKKTRLGCDTKFEKFESIVEYPAMWHTKQSFLGYIWEQLYRPNPTSGREIGTLYHIRQLFHMTNVYKSVKKNYKTAENLMLSTTKAYLCCAFMDFTGMDSLDGTPSKIDLPTQENSDNDKTTVFTDLITKFVEDYVMVEFDVERAWREQQEQKRIQETPNPTTCTLSSTSTTEFTPGQNIVLVFPKNQGGYKVVGVGRVIDLNEASVNQAHVPLFIISLEPDAQIPVSLGQIVMWPRSLTAIPTRPNTTQQTSESSEKPSPPTQKPLQSDESKTSEKKHSHPEPLQSDRLSNYASQCLQLGVMLMQLNDTEKEGDGDRSIMNMKLLMLYFRSRKRGMKYAYEVMRMITCVKALYTPKMAHCIIHGQFVNMKGGAGRNYANDLQMEMSIKNHKVMLRGMCGNKTLKAVERSTRASHSLKSLVDVFDQESNVPPDSTSHTHASSTDDIKVIINLFKSVKPFDKIAGRNLKSFPSITQSPLDQLDTATLYTWLKRHKRRLARDAFAACDDSQEDDYVDENSHDDPDDDDDALDDEF